MLIDLDHRGLKVRQEPNSLGFPSWLQIEPGTGWSWVLSFAGHGALVSVQTAPTQFSALPVCDRSQLVSSRGNPDRARHRRLWWGAGYSCRMSRWMLLGSIRIPKR